MSAITLIAAHTEAGVSADQGPFAPFLDAAQRFTAAALKYVEDSAAGGDGARLAAQAFGDFLRDQSGALFTIAPVTTPPEMPALGSPALGLTREHQLRTERAAAAARRAADAQRRLQGLWFDALRDAAGAFVSRVAAPQLAAGAACVAHAASLRGLYDCWIDCAEQAYAVIVRGDAYCDALADLINAGSEWRRETCAALEHGAHAFDLPTRSELNSLTRRLAALEEQLRLEREQQAAAVNPQGRPRTPRTRRAARRAPKS